MAAFILDLFGGDVDFGKPPRLPSGLYFFCGRCEVRCKALEAGSEDEDGTSYCRECTRKMWLESEATLDLAKDSRFIAPDLARYNPCAIRRPKIAKPEGTQQLNNAMADAQA